MASLVVVALIVATIVILTVPSGEAVDRANVDQLTQFLRVFIAFMLGLHVNSSYQKWQKITDGLFELFNAVMNMNSQLLTLGVPKESRDLCCRYGMLSCLLVTLEAELTWVSSKEAQERKWRRALRGLVREDGVLTEE